MAWVPQSNATGFPAIADTSTTARVPTGTIIGAYDPTFGGGEFIYLKGGANVVAGSMVQYSANSTTDGVALTSTTGVVERGYPVAVAMAATTAALWGWFQISGRATVLKTNVKVDPVAATGLKVYLSGTAGRVAIASVTGRQILGARFSAATTVTTTTSTCVVLLNRASQGPSI